MDKTPGIESVGKYKVNRIIGYGSMGIVYECLDPQFRRIVAVKVLHGHLLDSEKSDEYLQRFKNEIFASGSLSHPNIVIVYDADFLARPPYLVMEFVDGVELTNLIHGADNIGYDRACAIVLDILKGLKEIHSAGIVHRDLKPSNIFITKDKTAKIADFGVARVEGSELTQIGDVIGSPKYMSPEQCMGQPLDLRSDIFTVGTILYELLTGQSCFSGNSYTVVANKIVSEIAPTPSKIDSSLKIFDKIVKKALAKKPEKRFQSAAEFIVEIEALTDVILQSDTVRMQRTSKGSKAGSSTAQATIGFNWRNKLSRVAVATIVLLLIGIPIYLYSKYDIDIRPSAELTSDPDDQEAAHDQSAQANPLPKKTDTVKVDEASEEAADVADFIAESDKPTTINQVNSKPPVYDSTQLELNKQEKIWRLLNIADTYLNMERLLAPRGSNALDTYKAILSIEQNNEQALAGIDRVKKLVVERIQKDIDQKNIGFAREMLVLAKETFPQDSSWAYFDIRLGINANKD